MVVEVMERLEDAKDDGYDEGMGAPRGHSGDVTVDVVKKDAKIQAATGGAQSMATLEEVEDPERPQGLALGNA